MGLIRKTYQPHLLFTGRSSILLICSLFRQTLSTCKPVNFSTYLCTCLVKMSIMSEEIVNKVAQSQLVTLDLESYFPAEEIVVFDLKPHLFMELILKEKEFRAALQNNDWSVYKDKVVAVTCTADAIIPMWAYMLVASYLQPVAKDVIFGDEQTARQQLFVQKIEAIDTEPFVDKKIVVKGCGDVPIGEFAYLAITKKLMPVARSLMYGEPCSTVPIFKRK